MNLRQLEVFQAVLQTGSMSAAARLLCITPSAVSKAVAHTELQLGYRLFNRTGGPHATQRPRCWPWSPGSIYRQLDALQRTARNLPPPNWAMCDWRPSLHHARVLPTCCTSMRCSTPGRCGSAHHSPGPDDAGLAHAQCGFWSGLFEHPHPQVHSELLVSGRLSLAVARTVWDRAPRAAAPAARLAQVPAIRLVGTTHAPVHRQHRTPPGHPRRARHPGADLAAGAGAGAAGHGLDGGGLPHRHSPGPGPHRGGGTARPAAHVALQLHASQHPPGLHATRMLAMLPALLHQALSPRPRA